MGEFGEGGCRSPQHFACLPIEVILHGFLASFISKSVFFASPKQLELTLMSVKVHCNFRLMFRHFGAFRTNNDTLVKTKLRTR